MLLAAGAGLYFYNTNANFKTKVDGFIAQLKGNSAEATTDSGTTDTTTTDTTATTPTVVYTTPTTPQTIVLGGVTGVDAGNCKTLYGGNCSGECKDVTSSTCLSCLQICGRGGISVRSVKKSNSNNNQSKKENRTKSTTTKVPSTPKSKGDPSTSPFSTAKKPGCPARCDVFRTSSPSTYTTCCKGG